MQSLFGNQNAPKEKNVHFVRDTTMVAYTTHSSSTFDATSAIIRPELVEIEFST